MHRTTYEDLCMDLVDAIDPQSAKDYPMEPESYHSSNKDFIDTCVAKKEDSMYKTTYQDSYFNKNCDLKVGES